MERSKYVPQFQERRRRRLEAARIKSLSVSNLFLLLEKHEQGFQLFSPKLLWIRRERSNHGLFRISTSVA